MALRIEDLGTAMRRIRPFFEEFEVEVRDKVLDEAAALVRAHRDRFLGDGDRAGLRLLQALLDELLALKAPPRKKRS